MPRRPRLVVPGLPHHITHRGSNRQALFSSDSDRQAYLQRLFGLSGLYHLRLHAYCLLADHVHFIATPDTPEALASVFGRLQSDHARAANFLNGSTGPLWASRYYSAPMDISHALVAISYIEQNPVRAKLVASPLDYPWSTARAHVSGSNLDGHLDLSFWRDAIEPEYWTHVLRVLHPSQAWATRFREATRRGLPFGPEPFVAQLSLKTGRDLFLHPPGRPTNRAREHTREVLAACA